jgi:hypothetical protein
MKKESSIQSSDGTHPCSSFSETTTVTVTTTSSVSHNNNYHHHDDRSTTTSNGSKRRIRRSIHNIESHEIQLPPLFIHHYDWHGSSNENNNGNNNMNKNYDKLVGYVLDRMNRMNHWILPITSCYYPVHDAIMTSSDMILKSSSPKCYVPGLISSEQDIILDDIIPSLIQYDLSNSTSHRIRSSALRRLYYYTDQYHQQNRYVYNQRMLLSLSSFPV